MTVLIINAVCLAFMIGYLWIAKGGVLGDAAEELSLGRKSRESQEIDLRHLHTTT